MPQAAVPAAFWRGGTSRAVMFKEQDLAPFHPDAREHIILAALGSPDPNQRQVDGLGGGISSLSKVCILDWADGEAKFNFGQVSVTEPEIDWSGTCGNMSAAIGPFAIEAGWITAHEPVTEVPVLAVNTDKRFVAEVPVRDGGFEPEGDFAIDGVPGTAAMIGLRFLDPGGTQGRGLLPTGRERDVIAGCEATILDAVNPTVFVRAADLGLTGTEAAADIEVQPRVMARLEEIRSAAAELIGLGGAKAIPKIAAVAPGSGALQVLARAISMERAHRTLPAGSAVGMAVAAAIPGTVVQEALANGPSPQPSPKGRGSVAIGHPAGQMEIGAEVACVDGQWRCVSATTYRSARKIMDGNIYVPSRYLSGRPWYARP
ncbi:MAG TPA: PrpF domain-containing protein [Chloroflexota bacterium]